MSVEDSESRRFELTFGYVLLRPILAQHPSRIFSLFFLVWNFFFGRCAHSDRYRNLMAGIFEIQGFFGNTYGVSVYKQG